MAFLHPCTLRRSEISHGSRYESHGCHDDTDKETRKCLSDELIIQTAISAERVPDAFTHASVIVRASVK